MKTGSATRHLTAIALAITATACASGAGPQGDPSLTTPLSMTRYEHVAGYSFEYPSTWLVVDNGPISVVIQSTPAGTDPTWDPGEFRISASLSPGGLTDLGLGAVPLISDSGLTGAFLTQTVEDFTGDLAENGLAYFSRALFLLPKPVNGSKSLYLGFYAAEDTEAVRELHNEILASVEVTA